MTKSLLSRQPINHPLIILLIDNKGGGIFKQLNLGNLFKGNIEDLFVMKQTVDQLKLIEAYGFPCIEVLTSEELSLAVLKSLKIKGPIIIKVSTDTEETCLLRKDIANHIRNI